MSGQGHARAIRPWVLVVLMVLMPQTGYLEGWPWMVVEDAEPESILPPADTTPMATYSATGYPSLDADIRSGDLSDWTFWRPNATDSTGYRGGFDTFNNALPISDGDGRAYYAGYDSGAYTSSELGGASVTDGMLLFTHYSLDSGAVHTASANLSLNLPTSAFLSFTAVTRSNGWNDSFLDIAVHQSGSQISHTVVEPSSNSLTSEQVTLFVPAGSSTVSIATSVESVTTSIHGAGGFWGVHTFSVGGFATHLSLGADHACVLAIDSDTKCWGSNTAGQLGQGHVEHMGDETDEMGQSLPYVVLPENSMASDVSAGGEHTCYILQTATSDGMPLCFGRISTLGYGWSDDGSIGDAYLEDASMMPEWPLPTGRYVTQIEAGWNHTCALFDDGSLGCWGDNAHGQLGTENTTFLGDGYDEVGDGLALVDLPSGTNVTSIALGWDHTCVLYDTGDVACWGDNTYGQLGLEHSTSVGGNTGDMGGNLVNISLPSGLNVTHLSAGDGFTCATFSDDSIRCWGRNDIGQLGQGNTAHYGDDNGETVSALSAIDLGSSYASNTKIMDAGQDHVCSVILTSSTAGVVKCWGGNGDGQLGIGTAGSDQHRGDANGEMGANLPAIGMGIDVGGDMRFEVGNQFACLMRLSSSLTNPQVQCWGISDQGRLGYGNTEALGDSSSDTLPSNDVQLALNEPFAYGDCRDIDTPTQAQVDSNDAGRHLTLLAADSACPVMAYTDDTTGTLAIAVFHQNQWVKETVTEVAGDVTDLDLGLDAEGRMFMAWAEAPTPGTASVYVAGKDRGRWASTNLTGLSGLDEVGLLLHANGDLEVVGLAADNASFASVVCTSGSDCENAGSWSSNLSRTLNGGVTLSDLDVALDRDGTAYASYQANGDLQIVSKPAGGDGIGTDDWTNHVTVRSDLGDTGSTESNALVSTVGWLSGLTTVSANLSSGGASEGLANISTCTGGWSSCAAASGWTATASLSGVNTTLLAIDTDLDQRAYLAHLDDAGVGLTKLGPQGVLGDVETVWPHDVERVSLAIADQGTAYTAVRNQSDGTLWLVRVDAFAGRGLATDLDGDGWLGIDEMACGTDPNDDTSAPMDADGDGICDGEDTTDDDLHRLGTRALALGEHFGCAITGDLHLPGVQPALLCWGANHDRQLGNMTLDTNGDNRSASSVAVDLPKWSAPIDVSAGERHACVVLTQGEVMCWGANDHGQLGRSTNFSDASVGEVDLPEGVRALSVAAGDNHTCITDQRADAWCWGSNLNAEFGAHYAYNPNGVVPFDSIEHPSLFSEWDGSGPLSGFEHGFDGYQPLRVGCCGHQQTSVESMTFVAPYPVTLALLVTSSGFSQRFVFSVDGEEVISYTQSNSGSEVTVDLEAGHHTLTSEYLYRTGGGNGEMNYFSLRAELRGFELIDDGYGQSLPNSTQPLKQHRPSHALAGLDTSGSLTCGTDVGGNTSCTRLQFSPTSSTTMPSNSSTWQPLINNASAAPSTCAYSPSNGPDPLDVNFEPFPGISGREVTMVDHATLPVECTGLRVGRNTTWSTPFDDLHAVPVEPGHSYRVSVRTTHKYNTNNGQPHLDMDLYNPKNNQRSVQTLASSVVNDVIYTVDAYTDTMIVVVRGSDCNGICAYNLRVEEVGSPLEEASIRQVQAFEANHGLTAVGGDVMCTAGLNGVGVACQHHEQARALPVSSDLANTPLLWINETGARVRSLSVGEATACAVLDGSLACWGAEASGGLGDGGNTVSSRSNPVSVSLPAGWVPVEVAVSDHDERACALVRNATDARLVYCWGSDADGGLGDGGTFNGSEASPDTAVQHENADAERYADSFELDRQPWDVAEIVGHADFPCVRSHEGLVKCWVHPSLGRVYDAPKEMGANLPFVDLGTEVFATQLTQIQLRSSLNPQATCALLENGTVTCWGSASFSGVPATFSGYSRTSPNYVTATGDDRVVIGHGTSAGVLSDVVDIAQNCALLSNGTVRCWDPTGIRPHAEVDAGGATFVALFEGVALDSSSSGIEVCALHETLAQATCFTAPYSSNGYQPTSSREVRVATGIHDVLARRDSGGTEVTVLQGALTLTEDGSTVSAPPLKPGSLAFNRHDTAEVCGIGPDSLPFCTDEAFNTMDFGGRIEQMDKSCFLRTDAEVLCIGEPALLGQAGRAQATTSPGESLRYGTIELDLRNHDSDGDGTKDLWDADDDDDGVADWNDAFPIDPCASKDTDLDGNPDALVSNCSTVLTEDADDDNDGWSDMDEAVCDTDSTLNTQVPHDTDGDGTCDANDTDLDGDGWSNDDERACAPDQVVVRDLASFEGRHGLGSVFMGGAHRSTPMLLAGETGDYAVYLLDLTASDPFTTLQNLHPDVNTYSPVGGRVSIAGDHLGVTMYEAGRTDYVAMTYDSNGTYAPTLFTRNANSPSDPFAPYLEVDGNLMFRGQQTLQPVDGPSIPAPSLPYPVTVLRLPDGGLLTVGSPDEPHYEGVWTQRTAQLPRLQTWNISYSEWDDPSSLNLQGGSLGINPRAAAKAVLDDNGTVHLVYPAYSIGGNVFYYQYVVLNASGLHLIGNLYGVLSHNQFSSSSFGLDYTPEGGVRLSYAMSNRSVALVELNTSGSHTTTVLPGGPLDSDFEVAAVGHVTNGVGQSTVVVVPEGDSVQDHGAPLRIVQPILRFDPAVNPAWEPHDTNNDGTCDASTGAMLYFGSEDLLFEVNRFSSETPFAFGVHEVTGVTALSGLPAGLSVNSSTGAISGTPTVAVPEGVNVTLRIASNGTTTDLVVRMVINEPVMVNAPPVWSVGSHDLENVPWFATSVDGRMYTLKRGGSGTDSFGNTYDANDLLLTAYHPGGSGTVNWTTRIESYSTTFGIDLAVNPQGEPLVLFRAVHSNNHNEDNNVHLSQDPDTLGVDGVCSTPDNSTHRCTGSGNNNDRLVLVAYGLDGHVNWTQAQQYPAVNRSVTYQPDTTWGDEVETSDALSIGADGSIAVAVPFKSNAGYYRNHNTPSHPYPLGFFGGHEIEVLGSRSSSTNNRFMMLAQLSAEGEVNWVRTTETPDTTSNNQQAFLDVQLDRTSDGGVLLSYLSFGHHAWDDLVLPRLSYSQSLVYCGSCKNYLNHYMVMFDADGTPLWYQHDGVSHNQVRAYAQVLLEDDTIVIVAVTHQSQGYYHDAGVTNTTSGRPALSDSNFDAAAAFGTVAYNATSLPGDALNMFVFRASDGALTDVHSLDSNITVREGFETTGMGSGPHIRAVADGDVFHLFALSDIPGTEHRMDHWTVNGSGTVITAMATPDVASQSIDDLGRLRLGAAGLPVLQLERPYNAGGSNDPPISPYAVTWYTADGRTVAGALTDMVRFAAAQGHMIERNMPRADQSAPTPLYPDLVNRHVWSTSSDLCNGGQMGAEWSLVALNGSTWLPSGFTFDADCGKLSFSGTLSSMNVTPYWLNLSVDGRPFSQQVMIGVAPDAPTLTLPANATFTRGLSGSVFPTDLNGTGLQAARITPELPAGLTLQANASIVGTPTVNLTTTSYSVELCNDWNLCVTERITLQINEQLANLTYGGNNSLWLPRDSQVDITPVNTGGEVASFSLNGTLPLGMYFDTETGRIYGNAYLLQNTSSVNITANNSGGSFTVEVNITIPGTGITLAFPAESLSLTNGTTMQNFGGQTSGETPASWSVSPALPSGLAIGSTNGTVYGTPTVEASAADYTVTVTSTSGATATFVLNIEVLAPVEEIDLTLSTASLTLTNNTTMQPFTGQTSGDAPASWTISPNLTGGLQFGTSNGTLWGTPNATSPAVSYVITVYTAGGANDSESVTIAVVAPTISLDYPASSLSLTNGTTMQSFGAQTTGSAAASYTVSPSLPTGLSLGSSNGTLYGTPVLATPANEYSVTVTSVAGTTDTFALSIEVLEPVESITLTLPAASLSLSNNTTMQPFTGQTTGDAPSTWTISPNLTSGLQFGTTNGTLWGTPNATSSAVTYTITVYTAAGANDSATVDIAVVAPAITLQYPATSLSLVNGTTMQSFGGQTSGAAASSFSISPTLPSGLSLGSFNGTIFGTPTATASPTDHTVTVTSVAGTTATFVVNIEVLEPVESITLTLPATTLNLVNNSTMQPFTGQTTGNAPSTWTISPNLTAGLQFGTSNGTLWGTPTNASGPVVYTITVYTVSGANDSATFTVEVGPDFDGDGLPDHVDPDDDNDGLPDVDEPAGCRLNPDCDDDGYLDGIDAFPVDPNEWIDTDDDGIGNNADDDDDGDGWNETMETECGNHSDLDAFDRPSDLDGDGICDALDDVDDRPIYLSLREESLVLTVNATMTPIEVSRFGSDIRNWTVTPDLPAGLMLDDNGRITGTPTELSNLTVYTINASNNLHWATVNLSITVQEALPDFDSDGIPDEVDPDDDNDGFSDMTEEACGSDGRNASSVPSDIDGDALCDAMDPDMDGDGLANVNETNTGVWNGSNNTGTDPANPDTDGDGYCDGPLTVLVGNALFCLGGPDPDPHDPTMPADTDGDGLVDELPDGYTGLLMVDDDDDNDGFSDAIEAECGSDARNSTSVPSDMDGDRLCDNIDPDSDGDGLNNSIEAELGTSNLSADTDGDGYCDGPVSPPYDDCLPGPDAFPLDPAAHRDTDGDGLPDDLFGTSTSVPMLVEDLDDDGDNWSDDDEFQCGTNSKDGTDVPVDSNDDGTCDALDTVHMLSYVFEYPTEIVDLKVDEPMTPFVPYVNGSGEVLTWELVGDLPEGLVFGESMGRQANANGAISGTPTSVTPETLFVVVWANNSAYAQAFNLSFTVYADDDNDSLPDDLPDNYPGTLRLDTDDDNDGYDDSMELTCGSNPDDPNSDPFNEDASICTGASQVIETEEGINWMLCFPCLLLLLALFLLLLLIGRDRLVVLEVGPEPENTELDPEVKAGTGTLEDPFILKPLTGVKPGDVVLSKEIVTVSNMTVESVFLMDLDESVNQRRFHMVDERNSDESLRVVPVSEEGDIEVRFRFDDSMVPTLTGGTYTGLLKLGKASVYLQWSVTVEADPKARKAAEAESEAKRLAAKEAAAQRDAKEKADAKAAAAAKKAQAKAEAKAAAALKKAEDEAAAAKAKAEAELAEAKAEAERDIAEAKAKAAAEAQAMKAQAEAEAAEKKAAEAAAAAEAKAKAEQEIAEAKALAEKEAAEVKAKAEAEAEAAEAERRRQAEAEAAERQAKMEAELEERRKRLADLDDKARKKEEELIRVAEKSKTIDFGTLGVAASTGLSEDVAKGADTLVVADTSKFEEKGEAYIADAEGGLRIAWTGKAGSTLIGVTGLKRAFAALATVTVADDLQRIKGIGPFIEDKLHALGIYTFRQVGNMTPELEETVNVAIEFFSGRIKRDEWARQAREFEDAKDD